MPVQKDAKVQLAVVHDLAGVVVRADERIGDAARYDLHGDVLGSAHTHTRICFMAAHSRTTSYSPLPLWFSLVNVSAMALWSYTYLIAARISFALADNLADGNPGKRKLAVLDFTDSAADLEGQTMPPPKAFLAARQKNGKDLLAVQVYEETWRWLADRECARLVPAQILEQYAMAISRWIQCEEAVTEYGFLAKHPTTGNAIPSPYVAMSQSFSKQANNLWYQIYQVVRENCSVEYKGATPHDDMMERLLTARRGG